MVTVQERNERNERILRGESKYPVHRGMKRVAAALYYGDKYRERCAAEMRDTTCREGMSVKLSATGLKPNVRPHLDMRDPIRKVKLHFDEHTRALVVQAWSSNQLLLLHLDTMKKFYSRPRNWEPADD